MLVSLTVGKVDAGVTVLLTPDKRLIEFPSILLPPDISSGSIVDITVSRNTASEVASERAFAALQDQIYAAFGAAEPSAPALRCRNATQTSVVLEWDPIQLATADLISLALYRNGQKAGHIPQPLAMHTTKISGLAVDTEYTFHLVLRTTAGTYSSEKVPVRTHKMTDLSGITIATGILPPAVREAVAQAVERMGAKLVDGVRIDTTHFVTTEGRGLAWEKANKMNIPVVLPEWVEACAKSGRILGVTKFYLDTQKGPPGQGSPVAPVQQQPPPPPQPAPPAQKDLPAPPAPQNGEAAASTEATSPTGAEPATAAAKKEEAVDEDDDSESESEAEEQEPDEKTKATGDEQKARVEDKEQQKVALRPGPPPAKSPTVEDEPEEEADEKPEASPGNDGASFQDVAL
ncbi:Cell fusion protein cfr1 [Pleurostoma richardsiae]|uniref:Cell fusion protein cfr1 n=1 Tax=Pleurostoma richardsiae TaxID=41990 RepID=A0AA38RN97_9PEZI|nr:Cell fusion protein cfr1 [Pleurostoma richardsiae]